MTDLLKDLEPGDSIRDNIGRTIVVEDSGFKNGRPTLEGTDTDGNPTWVYESDVAAVLKAPAIDAATPADTAENRLCYDLLVLGSAEPLVYVEVAGGRVDAVRTNVRGLRLVLLDLDVLKHVEDVPTGDGSIVQSIIAAAQALPEELA